jgi:tetratricopeptide (TPR) repeat protein
MSGILRRIASALRGEGRGASGRSSAAQASIEDRLREGMRVLRAGDLQQAAEIYREILELDHRNPEAYLRLGEISHEAGDIAGATELFERAVEFGPGEARYHYPLGSVLESSGQLARAAACYRTTLAIDPDHAAAHNNLGRILQHLGEMAAYSGTDAAGLSRVGSSDGEAPETRSPEEIRQLGRQWMDEAVGHFRAAARIAPGFAFAELNLGFCLAGKQRFVEALEHYHRAIAIDPDLAEAHFNSALALLAQGKFAEAWPEYEWRWRRSDVPPRPRFDRPEWDGSSCDQQTLLLYTEQGFGDSIQFARYVPLLASRGAKVVVQTHPALRELLRTLNGVSDVVAHGDSLPAFDRHFPLLSVPHALGTTLDHIPAEVPYLASSADLAEKWRARLAALDGTAGRARKVGLVWASEPRNRIAPMKSVTLDQFEPLRSVADTQFYSLQTGDAARQARDPSAPIAVADLADGITSFADTAAIIANLDLVISIDTAVAHLAGAMGKPVWTLLQYAPDWRWYPLGEKSLWYPTMRLFRQPAPADWSSVLAQVAEELNALGPSRS